MSDVRNAGAPASASNYPSATAAWAALAVLMVVYVVSFVDRFVLSFVVAPLKAELGINDSQVGMLQSALSISYAVLAMPVGYCLDRYSRRTVIFAGMFFWSICATLSGVAKSFPILFLARAGVGAGEAVTTPGGYSIIGDSFPPHRLSLAMSLFTVGGSIGVGLAFLLGGPLVQLLSEHGAIMVPVLGEIQPWQQAFIVTGVPGMALAFLIYALREPERRQTKVEKTGGGYGEVFAYIGKYKLFYVALFLSIALAQSAMSSVQFWLPAYFARVHGLSAAASGIGMGIGQMGIALIGMWIHGITADRLFARGMKDAHFVWAAGAAILGIPICLMLFGTSDAWFAMIMFAVFFLVVAGMNAVGPAVLQIVTPSALSGRISSIYILAVLAANSIGPTIVGLLTDRLFGDPTKIGRALLIYDIVLLTISAVLLLAARKSARQAVIEVEAARDM
jgi:MFS family permease